MVRTAPVAEAPYPVTAVGSPLNPTSIASVVAMPDPATVTTVAQAPEAMALVPIAAVPVAIRTPNAPALPVFTPRAVPHASAGCYSLRSLTSSASHNRAARQCRCAGDDC